MRKLLALPIQIPFKRLEDFCKSHEIDKLSLFGSVLTEDFTSTSDIDLLVEFVKGKTPGLAIIDLQDELSQMLGREVDLRTPAELSRFFRDKVLAEAVVLYVQD
ncbi:nucleotidyltransferase [Pleurocapsa sp. CCALA 161]|uniref:nucleotidyltransferase family protein n=1 Tax=Pleurocapsa sp. CCALA 161 TaxID=2107688 RepID=UPI000D06580E|nr:nucleotidyltransferase domain-containing protein [Pleurocapsa sp. CCALA 161]PSB08787.1 nucleotidyltransferase [Pleurocapsa sp. CCALA 161]